jgi:riboflavin kinase/FMN adenylyltransferase
VDVLNGIGEIRPRHRGAVVTIGNFDGVHLGHQKIIGTVLGEAAGLGARSMAITFRPHPMKVLRPEQDVRVLTPPEEKARLMKAYGIDSVLFIPFDRAFAGTEADDFINEVLVGKLAVRMVVVGHGYAFGRGKKGTTELLRRRGRKFGFGVRVVRNAARGGNVVSSSLIRSLLGRGRVREAARYLGRPYMIEGTVEKGAGRGARLLDTPTANISTPNELVPKKGVYAVRAAVGARTFDGVASIGTNPTFPGAGQSYEVHLFGFSGDLRGEGLRVYFVDRLRDEARFPDAEALHDQIRADISRAKEILRKSPLRPI